jgi:hypothetical protein
VYIYAINFFTCWFYFPLCHGYTKQQKKGQDKKVKVFVKKRKEKVDMGTSKGRMEIMKMRDTYVCRYVCKYMLIVCIMA